MRFRTNGLISVAVFVASFAFMAQFEPDLVKVLFMTFPIGIFSYGILLMWTDRTMIAMVQKLGFPVIQAMVFQVASKKLIFLYFKPGEKNEKDYTEDDKCLAEEYYDYGVKDADIYNNSFSFRWILNADRCPECCGPIISVEKKELEPNKYHEIFVCEGCGEHFEFDVEDD